MRSVEVEGHVLGQREHLARHVHDVLREQTDPGDGRSEVRAGPSRRGVGPQQVAAVGAGHRAHDGDQGHHSFDAVWQKAYVPVDTGLEGPQYSEFSLGRRR